jgi:hypothetical protein
MNLKAAWIFVAGDSRRGPAGVVVALVAVGAIVRLTAEPLHGYAGPLFVAMLAAALIASVFE